MDLTPRPTPDAAAPSTRRRWLPLAVLALVVVAGGVLVTRFLTSAVDYYCNVDEIGDRAGCEAGRSLRVQGTVEAGSIDRTEGTTSFVIAFNDEELPVRYEGEPGGIFDDCIPVVVHGRIEDDGVLRGTRVEVKHSSEYVDENEQRLDDAVDRSGAEQCSPQA
ncbi:MAG: cytochrome c maturation protein CcmE [Actinomycetota bacterium]|nr:cytochrome c maturation protein CcmE [Actinomycetota bacterium]